MTTTDSGFVSGSRGTSPKRGEEEGAGRHLQPGWNMGGEGVGLARPCGQSNALDHAPGGLHRVFHPAFRSSFPARGTSLRLGARLETSAWNRRPGNVGPGTEHSSGCVFTSVRRRDSNL